MARPRNATPAFKLAQRGGRLYVTWWADGSRHRVSTGTADPAAARRFLADFVAGFAAPAPPAAPSIGAILDGYLADRKPRVASYATLEAAAKALRRHLGDLAADLMTKERGRFYVRQRRAEGYLVGPPSARRKKPVSDGTIQRELVTLRAAMAWAVGEKWLTAAPAIEVPSSAPPRNRWLTTAEACALLQGCRANHVRLFVLLALHTAARAGALLGLTWDRVDLEARRIDLGPAVGRKGRAVIPINDSLLPELVAAHEARSGDHVIETAGGAAVDSIKTGFRAACRRGGLEGVTPHVLRHTAATWMARAGVPIPDIAMYLGHRDSKTTEQVYGKHHPDFLAGAAAALAGAFPGQLAPETKPARKRKT